MTPISTPLLLSVTADHAGRRLDHFLQEQLPQYSRSRLQSWAKDGRVLISGRAAKPSLVLKGGEQVEVRPAELPPLRASAEEMPLTVLYEDDDVIAIDKPAGVVVHAGAGVHSGTLVNALLHRFGQLSQLGGELRPGIVHRLDRYTSGILLVARHDAAHRVLARQFAAREVEKIYLTLVHGTLSRKQGRIDTPITRDPVRRTRMTTRLDRGRTALTMYQVLRELPSFSFLQVRIGTGRTHQIRVHLSSIGHPVAGDKLYGAPAGPFGPRYFLHAHQITFRRPADHEPLTLTSPLPPDLTDWLNRLSPSQTS